VHNPSTPRAVRWGSVALRVLVAALLGTPIVLVARVEPADAAGPRAFSLRYSVNTSGFTRLRGNTVLECNTALSSSCATASAAPVGNTSNNTTYNNNSQPQRYVDVDGDPSTFNSSTADVPWDPAAGASVLFAGLYWGGARIGSPTPSLQNQVRFKGPGQAYTTVVDTNGVDDIPTSSEGTYQGSADVTALVQAAGPGTYTVANLQTRSGTNAFGGWTLVVVVSDPREPPRNMTVFDGFQIVCTGSCGSGRLDIPVSGFQTPPAGTVRTRVGTVAYEGDRGSVGDQLLLDGNVLSDTSNPGTNYFNSSISDGLTPVVRNPSASNTFGFDIDRIQTSLPNGATSATLSLRTSGDFYYPGVVTFETELYSPKLDVTKSVTDVNGGDTRPGDELLYTVTVRNSGQDAASKVVLSDLVPAGTTYVAGSVRVDGAVRTDATGDDQADVGGGTVRVRLGSGASSSTGGSLAVGASTTVAFRVRVGTTVPDQTVVANTAQVAYVGAQTGLALEAQGSASSTVENPQADVSVAKSGGPFTAGAEGTYEIVVRNDGPQDALAPVRVVDTLPEGFDFGGASAPGWTCTSSGTTRLTVTCVLGTGLAAGTTASTISLRVGVDPTAAASSVTNTATVSSATPDPDPSDNRVDQVAAVARSADLRVSKENQEPAIVDVAEDVQVTVTNFGPSTAAGPVTITENVPPGFAYQGFTGTGWTCPAAPAGPAVTCSYGEGLDVAQAAPLLTLRLDVTSAATGVVSNVVTAASATPDPTPATFTDPMTVSRVADLDIEKTHTGTISSTNPFRISVTNNGFSRLAPGTVITVNDTLPPGTVLRSTSPTSWVCADLGVELTCRFTLASELLAGDGLPDLVVLVDPPTGAASLTNRAELVHTGAPYTDRVSANDVAFDSFDVPAAADLAVTKTVVSTPVVAGTDVTFRLDVVNDGPDEAAGPIVVTDPFAAFLTYRPDASDPRCALSGIAVQCTIAGGLTNGASASFLVTGRLSAALAAGQRINAAQVNGPTPDPVPLNDTSTATYVATRAADLSVTKTGPATATPGAAIDYEVVVTNGGPSTAEGPIELVDILPDGTRFLSSSSADPWVCVGVSIVNCTLPLDLGATVPTNASTLTLRVFLDPTLTTLKPNTVTVTSATLDPTGPATPPTPAVVTLAPQADLALTKDDRGVTAVPGRTLTYEMTVTNAGPALAAGPLVVTDTLPPGIDLQSASGAWTCTQAGRTVTCTNPDPLGPTVASVFELTVSVDPGVSVPIENTAAVAGPTPDPDPADNTASRTTPIRIEADLRMDKTARGLFPAGGTGLFTLDVLNAGPSTDPATITVTDPLPDGLTLASVSGSGWDCTASTLTQVSCTRPGPLPVGPAPRIDLRVDVDPGLSGSVVNSARAESPTPEPPGADVAANNDDVSTGIIDRRVDLRLAKTHAATAVAGATVVYELVVTNDGPATLLAGERLAVQDLLPLPLSAVLARLAPSSWTCAGTSTVDCQLFLDADLAVGASAPPLRLEVAVPADQPPGPLVNEATVRGFTSGGAALPDDDPVDDTATDPTTVTTSADLTLTKTPGGTITAGSTGTFTLTVSNGGPSVATGPITLVDTLLPAASFVGASAGWVCSNTAGEVTCTSPDPLAVGEGRSLQVTVAVAPTWESTGLDNTARATSGTADPDGATASVVLPVDQRADLSITKSATGAVVAGDLLTYTLSYRNDGPTAASDVVVTDTLPDGVSLVAAVPATCAASGPVVSCDPVPSLAPGTGGEVTLTVRLDDDLPRATVLTNAASVASTSGTTPDPDLSDNTDTATVSSLVRADLAVAKTHAPATFTAGSTGTFTMAIANLGPSAMATGTTVTAFDSLPSGLTFTGTTSAGWSCTGTSTVTCTHTTPSSVPVGGEVAPLTIEVDLDDAVTGAILNTVTIDTADDANPANDTATDDAAVDAKADLSVLKTAAASSVVAGATLTYTLSYVNDGPSVATAVVVADVLPAGTSFVSATAPCVELLGVVTCAVGEVADGGTGSLTLTLLVDSDRSPGPLANTATVSSTTADPDPSDDQSTVVVAVSARADLAVVKTVGSTGSFVAGEQASFAVAVTNAGPSLATDVVVTDTLPAGVTVASVSLPGATCTTSAAGFTCTLPALAATATATALVTVDLDPGVPGTVTNTASAATSVTDPHPGNDTGSVDATVAASADLTLAKAGPATAVAGATASWTLTVSNDGPSVASGPIVVSDTLPASTVFAGGTGTGWSCTAGPPVDCVHPGPLAPGASLPGLTLSALLLPSAAGTLVNTATVASATTDTVSSNDAATATLTALGLADLRLTKAGPASLVPGATGTYTVSVANAGPSDSPGTVTVLDTLPTGLSAVSGGGNGWTCTLAGASASCALPSGLTAGSSSSFTIDVAVAPDVIDPVTNTATVLGPASDPVPADNTGSSTTPVAPASNLRVAKTGPATAVAGGLVTYQVSVTNLGPSDATGPLAVVDPLPAGLAFDGASGSGWSCGAAASLVTCTYSAVVPAGGVAEPLTIRAEVDPLAPGGAALTNSLLASGPTAPATGASTSATVELVADLSLAKTTPATFVVGEAGRYDLTVVNEGPSALPAGAVLTVTDTLPPGQSLAGDPSPWACTGTVSLRCTLTLGSSFPVQGSVGLTLPVSVTTEATVANAATVAPASLGAATFTDPLLVNNDATTTPVVTSRADLSLTKVSDPSSFTAGATGAYTIVVTNDGPSPAADVVVTDLLPPGFTAASASAGWDCGTLPSAGPLTCTVATPVDAGGTATLRLGVRVDADLPPAPAGNVATVASSTTDPDPGDDTVNSTADVTTAADLRIALTAPSSAPAGTVVDLVVDIANDGPSDAASPSFTLTLPPGVTLDGAAPAGCTDGDGAVTCTLGPSLTTGATAARTLRARLAPALGGQTVAPAVAVASSTTDPDPTDGAARATLLVTAEADLSVTKRVVTSAADVLAGRRVVFELTVTNDGPSDVSNVVVPDALPAGLAFAASGSSSLCGLGELGVECVVPVMPAGSSVVLTLAADIDPASVGDRTNLAEVVVPSGVTDPVEQPDGEAPFTILSIADLAVRASTTPVTAGTDTSVVLAVTNGGPSSASSATVRFPLPPGASFRSAGGDGWVCTFAAPEVTCTPSSPVSPAGAAPPLTLVLGIAADAAPGPLAMAVSVVSTSTDPVAANSTDVPVVLTVLAPPPPPPVVPPGPPPTVPATRTVTLRATPVCRADVPYLDYVVTASFPATSTTLRWYDVAGVERLTQPGLPLEGRLLWPGAEVDAAGRPLDWPGWVFSGGRWVQADDGFAWARAPLTLTAEVNPTSTPVAVAYPPPTATCVAAPRGELPATGHDPSRAVQVSLLALAAGVGLLAAARRRNRGAA